MIQVASQTLTLKVFESLPETVPASEFRSGKIYQDKTACKVISV